MNSTSSAYHDQGMTLRQAALVSGIGLLIMAVTAPFAEFFVYAKLIVSGDISQTVQNIQGNRGLFLTGIFAFLIVFICDVIVAWALYVLLIPVNQSLSLLTAWFRLVYTAIALFGLTKLAVIFRLLSSSDYQSTIGTDPLHAQIQLLLSSFRYEWGLGLILFGIHLCLLGYLVYRSGFIPRTLGVLLAIAGLGWVIYELGPYFFPDADIGFLFITFFAELIFMGWLLVRGWKIQ